MDKFIEYWFPVGIGMIIIFSFSSIPNLTPGLHSVGANTLVSKAAHISEYAILTFLVIRALGAYMRRFTFQSILQIAFLVVLFFAISDEFHQTMVLGREGTFRDVCIDAIGIALVCLRLSRRSPRTNSSPVRSQSW